MFELNSASVRYIKLSFEPVSVSMLQLKYISNDVVLRLQQARLVFVLILFYCFGCYKSIGGSIYCHQYLYVFGSILLLGHTIVYSCLFLNEKCQKAMDLFNNELTIILVTLILMVLFGIIASMLRIKRYRRKIAVIKANQMKRTQEIFKHNQMQLNVGSNSPQTAHSMSLRDKEAASFAKPQMPQNSIYDYRVNLPSANIVKIMGWKGPNFSKNVYFRDHIFKSSLGQSIRHLLISADPKNHSKIQLAAILCILFAFFGIIIVIITVVTKIEIIAIIYAIIVIVCLVKYLRYKSKFRTNKAVLEWNEKVMVSLQNI